MKRANKIITILIFIFLYIPMAVLVVASFNTGKDITQFSGFTMKQYQRLFQDRTLLGLLGNSLLVSVLASLIATVFGTLSAVGINNLNPKLRKVAISSVISWITRSFSVLISTNATSRIGTSWNASRSLRIVFVKIALPAPIMTPLICLFIIKSFLFAPSQNSFG